jgi:excisionase family DNA binding protein
MTTTVSPVGYLPQMITIQEAAEFLHVSSRTVLSWIGDDLIPYIKLPGGSERAQYRIPLGALVSSLSGTFDLSAALAEGEARVAAANLSGEDLKRLVVESAVKD